MEYAPKVLVPQAALSSLHAQSEERPPWTSGARRADNPLGRRSDDGIWGLGGNDRVVGDGVVERTRGSAPREGGYTKIGGGDDHLYGGSGDDVLWVDGESVADDGTAILIGGADTFHFEDESGLDRTKHFLREDGDQIFLSASDLSWNDLDANDGGSLDDADASVTSTRSDTPIDVGLASGGSVAAWTRWRSFASPS